jgi:hypothetical protein
MKVKKTASIFALRGVFFPEVYTIVDRKQVTIGLNPYITTYQVYHEKGCHNLLSRK